MARLRDKHMAMSFSSEGLEKFEQIKARYPENHRRAALIPTLFLAQEEFGFVSVESMEYVAQLLELPPAKVLHAATFYTMFNKRPVGERHVQICKSVSCAVMGAHALVHYLEDKLGIAAGETTRDGKFTLQEVECLAACGYAPMLQCNEDYHENLGKPGEDGTWPEVDALLEQWGFQG